MCSYCVWNEKTQCGREGGRRRWGCKGSRLAVKYCGVCQLHPWCIGNHSHANYLKLTVGLGVTVHVTVFFCCYRWMGWRGGGIDAWVVLTIEFSFKLLPLNLVSCSTYVQGRDLDGPVTIWRGSQIFVPDSALRRAVWWCLCLWGTVFIASIKWE